MLSLICHLVPHLKYKASKLMGLSRTIIKIILLKPNGKKTQWRDKILISLKLKYQENLKQLLAYLFLLMVLIHLRSQLRVQENQ